MKSKLIFSVMFLALLGMIILPGCEKKSEGEIIEHHVFTTPELVGPADGAVVHMTGTSATLSWTSTNKEEDPVDADVYFGTESEPPLYKADHNALSITIDNVQPSTVYYWGVVMKDKNGMETWSPLWSFVKWEPIWDFLGDHNCDEPAEDYNYDVDFVRTSATVLTTHNYWNSGWTGNFTLNFTNNTYSMPVTAWGTWSAQESGTIDPATGKLVGNYTIWHNGVVAETGVHTYVRL